MELENHPMINQERLAKWKNARKMGDVMKLSRYEKAILSLDANQFPVGQTVEFNPGGLYYCVFDIPDEQQPRWHKEGDKRKWVKVDEIPQDSRPA